MPNTEGTQDSTNQNPNPEAQTQGGGQPELQQPQYATADQLTQLNEKLSLLQDNLKVMQSSFDPTTRQAETHKPAEPQSPVQPPTQEEWNKAVEDGNIAPLVARQSQYDTWRVQQDMERKFNDFRTQGYQTVSSLVQRVAQQDMPYYSRFKKEIDEQIGQIQRTNPELAMNPELYKWVHNAVVGQNLDAIVNEKTQEALRQGRENPSQVPGSTTGRTAGLKPGVPSAEELLGPEAKAALESKGMDEEMWAKRRGYDSWESFANMVLEQRGEKVTK